MAPLADHTVRSLNQLARQGRPEKVIAAVESLASKRLRPAVYHLNAVLNACRADWPRALSHMQHMCQEAVGVNKFSFTAALSAAAWQLAAALLRDMPRQVAPDTICYNAAMSTCHGEWAVALQWLQDMHSLLIERDFISFNAAITACISGGHWHIACALLADMQELLVEPLPSNVNAAISACASGRRWDVALRLLQGMAAAQLRADVMSFTAALGSCADPGLWASASGLLALMQSQEVAADIVSSNAAANVCAQGAQWQHAADILEDALKQSIQADGGLVSAVLSSSRADVENPQSWLFALALISRLEARGLGPRVQSRGSTLANCLRCGAWAHALHDQSSGMDMVCQTLAINAWHGARHWRHGLDLLRGLPLRRFAPDGPALNAGFAARDRRGAWTSAPQLLAQMRRQKLEVVTYSALGVLAQDGHWRKALALAGRDYTVIMACKEVGEWTVALTTLGGLERTVVREKQEFCWGSTISACKTGRQWMAAADLFHAMFARALKVDIVSSTATAAAAVDTWPLAMSVLGRARDARMAMDEKSFQLAFHGLQRSNCLEVLATFEEASTQRSVSFKPWALVTLGRASPAVVQDAFAEATCRLELGKAKPMELASLWWSACMAGASNRRFTHSLGQLARDQVHNFDFDELLVVLWGACGMPDLSLQLAFQREFAQRLSRLDWADLPLRFQQKLAQDAIGCLWASSFCGSLALVARRTVGRSLVQLGGLLDSTHKTYFPQPAGGFGSLGQTFESSPRVVLDAGDRVVLFKPPDWEVHDANSIFQLAGFMEAMFGPLPILRDEHHEHGFLHRLDVPSSGLILAAKSFEAFYRLQVQLATRQVLRDYLVLSHGWVQGDLAEIAAQVSIEDGGRTAAGGQGKPARTHLKVVAHASRPQSGLSLLVIRIGTGRRHQIRSHLAHVGHPTVTDGRYTSLQTFLADSDLCERNFLHRYYLGFRDVNQKLRRVFSPLPPDLCQALALLRGKRADCPVLRDWTSARQEDWTHHRSSRIVRSGSGLRGRLNRMGLGVPRMRRPRSATRLQTEVELSRTQAQINNLQAKVVAGSTEVERLQQKLEAAEADATLQRSLAATAKAQLSECLVSLACPAISGVAIGVLKSSFATLQLLVNQVCDERSERQIQQLQAKARCSKVKSMASFAESRMRDMQLELEKLSAQEVIVSLALWDMLWSTCYNGGPGNESALCAKVYCQPRARPDWGMSYGRRRTLRRNTFAVVS
ncbi:unnamed protein product [Effrenium voratum]|nr:unnamed protein product [Effrenium voratum]